LLRPSLATYLLSQQLYNPCTSCTLSFCFSMT
jgi:hypothetical protein